MNELKENDEVYFFIFPDDGCNFGPLNEIKLEKSIINASIDYYDRYYSTLWGMICKDVELFKSKADAIDAMRKRMDELENE